MSNIISKYSTLLVIVLSIVLGFALPGVGLIWKSFLVPLLMLLMFSLTLTVEPHEITRSVRNYRLVGIGVFTVFVVTPMLSLVSGLFFSSIVYAGVVLALCCPSAVATAFWAKVFRGDIAAAIVISTVTNLLSILTIPATMLIAVGAAVNVDVGGMMLNLAEIVLVPMLASFLVRKFVHIDWTKLGEYNSKIELGILVLLVWGSIAPGVANTLDNLGQFVVLNVFLLAVLAVALALAHFLTERLGHQKAVSIGIAATVKNAALSLVIGLTVFGSSVMPPLIANLVAQNMLLVFAKVLMKEE